jgi:hypothetical protein
MPKHKAANTAPANSGNTHKKPNVTGKVMRADIAPANHNAVNARKTGNRRLRITHQAKRASAIITHG